MGYEDRAIRVAVHWPRFGPYHLARLRAAREALRQAGVEILGFEIASRDEVYLWREETSSSVPKRMVFPGRTYEQISCREMWHGIARALQEVRPQVIAINGYSSWDAWAILAWSRAHRRPAILITDSKEDDAVRSRWKEGVKRAIVKQYSAALCAGTPHRKYLEQLGVRSERIFDGCDVVDNNYFWLGAERARRDPAACRSCPGLESAEPFFLASARCIERKNIDGLLWAYAEYRQRFQDDGRERAPWRLVILGDGCARQGLEKLVREERIEGVTFAGFCQIDVLPAYYGLAGVFIHPALNEQWALVINEAMAAGLPVLVSNHCGCAPDLISEGQNGFTFQPDDTTALAHLMMRVSTGQVDLRAMGLAARARIQEWGPERFAAGLYGALQAVLPDEKIKVRRVPERVGVTRS